MDIVKYNREAWNMETKKENPWTKPVSEEDIKKIKVGETANIVLTPTKRIPTSWYGDIKGKHVLCLASGGGQQGPMFAAMGAIVTVFDNSDEQLQTDEFVAQRDELCIHTIQGDMKDLSCFEDDSFDLIFHPVSNCFVDYIEPVQKECYRVLKAGGVFLAGFINPIVYIFDVVEWDKGNLVVNHKIPYADVDQLPREHLEERMKNQLPLEYGHSLEAQIGGLLHAGFLLADFYEDHAGGDILDAHINTFIAVKAIKYNTK